MGGTKKKAAVPIKKESKYKIPSRFDCPLCDAKNSIAVRLIRNTGSAKLHCRSCRAGHGREYPFLPLEKPVDVFFRFREELMQQDREFLQENNIETDAIIHKTGLAQLAPKGLGAVRGDELADGVAAMHRIELEEEDDDDNNTDNNEDDGTHYFADSTSAGYGNREEEDFAF